MSRPAKNHNRAERLTDAEREEYINAVESLIDEVAFFAHQILKDVDPMMELFRELMKR